MTQCKVNNATLYTSTKAFTDITPTRIRSPLTIISNKLDEWESKREYARKVFDYIQTLPDSEAELLEERRQWPVTQACIVDQKANYSKAKSDVINLQRYLELLRDDLKTHAAHGTPIKSAQAYVLEYYLGLIPLAETVLYTDDYQVIWTNVKHLEAIDWIVYWDQVAKRLILRWDVYELSI